VAYDVTEMHERRRLRAMFAPKLAVASGAGPIATLYVTRKPV
jgi:hypothetical protein